MAHGAAEASTLYAPKICPTPAQIEFKNQSSEPEYAWVQFQGPNGFDELRWTLSPNETKYISEEVLPVHEYVIRTSSSKIRVSTKCQNHVLPWVEKTSPSRQWRVTPGSKLKFFIQNLNPRAQDIMLHFRDALGMSLGVHKLSLDFYLKTHNFKFTVPPHAYFVDFESEGRVSVLLSSENTSVGKFLPEMSRAPAQVSVDTSSSYFLLANQEASQSFVVKISDPNLVKTARDLISQGSYKLLFADIEYGARSENRSLLSSESSPFSWKVGKVYGFNDFGHISCDASPQVVEEQIYDWLSKKRICFWGFHLKKELSADEVMSGKLKP